MPGNLSRLAVSSLLWSTSIKQQATSTFKTLYTPFSIIQARCSTTVPFFHQFPLPTTTCPLCLFTSTSLTLIAPAESSFSFSSSSFHLRVDHIGNRINQQGLQIPQNEQEGVHNGCTWIYKRIYFWFTFE